MASHNKFCKIWKNESNNISNIVEQCLISLNAGNVIAVPTDTIYGIAALAQSTTAVDKLYEIKKRHREKAIAICVGTIDEVKKWGCVTVSDEVLNDLLPGPVTLIFQRTCSLNPNLNPATDSIGIRIPDSSFINQLALHCNQPIALTSANISHGVSPLKVKEFEEIWCWLDVIVDEGTLSNNEQSRLGSTVVDLSRSGEFMIIREGCAHDRVLDILQNKYGLIKKETAD